MATSAVDICNLALSRIGKKAAVSNIDPPDGSDEALQCSRMYPIALDVILNARNWAFATRRTRLAKLSGVETAPWKYAYALPTGCLRVIDLQSEDAEYPPKAPFLLLHDQQPPEFEVVNAGTSLALLTNLETPTARYIARNTAVSQFSPGFVDALAWLLAAYLAGLTIRGETSFNYMGACQKQYELCMNKAAVLDASQTRMDKHYVPYGVRARNGGH